MRERAQRFDPRQVMHRPTFEVFHYREPRPEVVEMHHHDFYEVYCFLNGELEFRVEGRQYRLKRGDLLLINPMELHRPIIEPESTLYERIVLWINKEYLESLSDGEVRLDRCFDSTLPTHKNLLCPHSVQRTDMLTRLGELVRESYSEEYGSRLCADGIFRRFMVELNRLALHAGSGREEREESSPLISQVLAYLGEHCREELSLEQLARHFYVSKYHLSHEFSRTVGVSVYRYILLKRLQLARQQLLAGMTPGEVCVSCGFGDYTNFYRAFKAEYGISPRACTDGGG